MFSTDIWHCPLDKMWCCSVLTFITQRGNLLLILLLYLQLSNQNINTKYRSPVFSFLSFLRHIEKLFSYLLAGSLKHWPVLGCSGCSILWSCGSVQSQCSKKRTSWVICLYSFVVWILTQVFNSCAEYCLYILQEILIIKNALEIQVLGPYTKT